MGMKVGSSSADDDADVMVDINTTPLIDVMLVLLIMFIITIPIQTHAVKMNTPIPSNAAPPPKPPEIIRVEIDPDGTIGWNGEVIAPGDRASVQARLAAAAAKADQPELHIRPHKLAAYEHVAMVLAGAQRLGMTKIGIVGHEQFQ
jgi:biopolymer transport protein ExbD